MTSLSKQSISLNLNHLYFSVVKKNTPKLFRIYMALGKGSPSVGYEKLEDTKWEARRWFEQKYYELDKPTAFYKAIAHTGLFKTANKRTIIIQFVTAIICGSKMNYSQLKKARKIMKLLSRFDANQGF